MFILEDWSHDHTWERVLRGEPERFAAELATLGDARPDDRADLSRLVLELLLVVASAPEVVAEVRVRNGFVLVRRGDAVLDSDTFDLSSCVGGVARSILRRGL